ncbi:MAG: hypothetical protein KDB23_01210 [Planctomycetales bacterium]|nr:hypothetical protein [Planctomycetales bacterium]
MTVELATAKYFQDGALDAEEPMEGSVAYSQYQREASAAPRRTGVIVFSLLLLALGAFGGLGAFSGFASAAMGKQALIAKAETEASGASRNALYRMADMQERLKGVQLIQAGAQGALSLALLIGGLATLAGNVRATRFLATVCSFAILFVIGRTILQSYMVSQSIGIMHNESVAYGASGQEAGTVYGVATAVANGMMIVQCLVLTGFYFFASSTLRRYYQQACID